MNLDLQLHLDKLNDQIADFMEFMEDCSEELDDDDEKEYDFLTDESGISNTELDNLVESLYHISDLIEKIK